MNDLLEQFLIECRELVEAATQDLLALEATPHDKERIDSAFRGFHTLKGAAGIVEFPAMGQVMHAAEDVLASVRGGERPVSAELIGECLSCLDQVVQWLDEIEAGGTIPAAPDAAVASLIARLARSPTASSAASAEAIAENPDWIARFLDRHRTLLGDARAAFRYVPDADCFFRGEDPLAQVARVPGLLAMELSAREPWPGLDEFNTFECNLCITALTASSPGDTLAVLRSVSDQVEIHPLGERRDGGSDLSPDAMKVLEEQLLLASNNTAEGFAGRLGSAGLVAGNVLRHAGKPEAAKTVSVALARGQSEGNSEAFIDALRMVLEAPAAQPTSSVPEPSVPRSSSAEAAPRTQAARALRVDVDRIDALVNLAGELTAAKNAVGHSANRAREGVEPDILARALKDQYALLDRLVAELRRAVLEIRVLPMRQTFQQFPRLVREMARDLGKPVRLTIEGEATEADKATVEALFEPLLHVIRNALDHGIEAAADRGATGKPPTASVVLRATRQGDQVIVEVTDDGRGIDPATIRRVAAQRGVATEAALAEMPDAAVLELIFAPGFSTAASVTGLSGRGVGMDAVRSAVARLGGRVTVSSQPGAGTTVRFTLPFSVLMLRVMTVEVGGQVFGVPIDAVIETIRLPRDKISHAGAASVIVLRDRTVPLIPLAGLLNLSASGEANDGADARVVVVSAAGQTGALEVDQFGERMDVMLKPMEGLLSGATGFAGTTLLGDGRVLIVLDLQELLA